MIFVLGKLGFGYERALKLVHICQTRDCVTDRDRQISIISAQAQ